MITAKWIWIDEQGGDGYNEYRMARKVVTLPPVGRAQIAIAADTWYRLFVNGTWVHDGPCRSWSHHFQYDVHDITDQLREGENEIWVLVRYFGCGVFQRDPVRGGLLAQLDVETCNHEHLVVGTDETWEMGMTGGYPANMPKVGLGMEPFEAHDARDAGWIYKPADVVADCDSGPWKNPAPRDVALLTRTPVSFRHYLGAHVVDREWHGYTFPLIRLLYPRLKEGGGFTTMAAAAATVVFSDEDCEACLESYPTSEGPLIFVNGSAADGNSVKLSKGENLLLMLFEPWGHHNKEQGIRLVTDGKVELRNPTNTMDENPWDFVPFKDLLYHEHDHVIRDNNPSERLEARRRVEVRYTEVSKQVTGLESYRKQLSPLRMVDNGTWPVPNPHWQFECRQIIEGTEADVVQPEAAMKDDRKVTVIQPCRDGDIELCYDLGEQNCGYYEFEVDAPAGTVIDMFGVEYICEKRGIQHTWSNKNGLRYVCREGTNQYLSLKRRSGRYLYITIREQTGPVKLKHLRLVESTYPVNRVGSFESSDGQLDQIWEISERTLKLCMEDVFTDCPLYEQTMWVGDARNEGLLAMVAYEDVSDILRRCIRLAAQSLETYPFIPSHAPTSSTDAYLPAWCFLWGISIWDYYFYTGDREFLREIWPDVLKNLRGVEQWKDVHGLFTGPFWNMFDWIGVDSGHDTVTHNSMLLKGSLDALAKCAVEIGDEEAAEWIRGWSADLISALDKLWSSELQSYVDSIHSDGKFSRSMCIHTNFLSLLYDIVPEGRREAALQNVLNPPAGMLTLGSPFAMLYLYEALDKLGQHDRIIESIQTSYQSMLDVGATTVWEQFANGNAFNPDGFPTRSHCHAWSSSPILYLNLLILGIRQVEPGGSAYTISPRVNHTEFARGTSASFRGPIAVSWQKNGDFVDIDVQAPDGVSCSFVENETLTNFGVRWNNEIIKQPRTSEVSSESP
ncbi:MAG: alpha-L-rhamnosidase N-terminal domain-containing protein [Candidatus Sumerlaeia bacterium]|nr:alpha-L-rhamnosidase N-terminal domain-containing protein [Candidatus Sumerlaeia bacterium]